MTISNTTRKTTTSCNGSTHEFPFAFPLISEDDLVVQIKDSNNIITTLTLDSDYEVTAVNDNFENGGSVNTISYATGVKADYAWPTGNEIIIYRSTPLTQSVAFRRGREMNPSSEAGLDKVTMMMQELKEAVDRCIKTPIEDAGTDNEIPDETQRAGKYLVFDAAGNPYASSGAPEGVPVSSFVENILDDASADAVLATLLFSVFFRSLVGSTNIAALLTAMGLDTSLATLALPDNTTISAFGKTLVDDADAPAARITLGTSPTGSIILWPMETPPDGYLECNGAPISRTTYAALFAVIGTWYGNPVTAPVDQQFNLPDFRGRFLRAWDHSAGVDPDVTAGERPANGVVGATMTAGDHVGTIQADQIGSHRHTTSVGGTTNYYMGQTYNDSNSVSAGNTGYFGGDETRPRNVNLMVCIKY